MAWRGPGDKPLSKAMMVNLPTDIHPSPKVMAEFFRHKNQHDALIQFAHCLVDLWSVC